MILFRTNVETTVSEVHKLRVSTGEVPTLWSVLAVADGLFGLCGSERRADELFTCSVSPLSPISLVVSVDVKATCLLTWPAATEQPSH